MALSKMSWKRLSDSRHPLTSAISSSSSGSVIDVTSTIREECMLTTAQLTVKQKFRKSVPMGAGSSSYPFHVRKFTKFIEEVLVGGHAHVAVDFSQKNAVIL